MQLIPGIGPASAQEVLDHMMGAADPIRALLDMPSPSRAGDDWELVSPVHDRVDPEKLKSILTDVADIWVEQFVTGDSRGKIDFGSQGHALDSKPKKDLADFKQPERKIQVTKLDGGTLTLLGAPLIGRLADRYGKLPVYRVVKEKRATFAATAQQEVRRPKARTGLAVNLVLAGDWTDTGLPATIEGAIRSGRSAANVVLSL